MKHTLSIGEPSRRLAATSWPGYVHGQTCGWLFRQGVQTPAMWCMRAFRSSWGPI